MAGVSELCDSSDETIVSSHVKPSNVSAVQARNTGNSMEKKKVKYICTEELISLSDTAIKVPERVIRLLCVQNSI